MSLVKQMSLAVRTQRQYLGSDARRLHMPHIKGSSNLNPKGVSCRGEVYSHE